MLLKITAEKDGIEHSIVSIEEVSKMTKPIAEVSIVDEKNNYVVKKMRNVDPKIIALKMGY